LERNTNLSITPVSIRNTGYTPVVSLQNAIDPLPYLTDDLPGIGGTLRVQPEDFLVEELPAYEPCGEGEHLYLWIEKRSTSAEQLSRHIARVLGIPSREIGTAGLKDRHAVTRQYVSVPTRCADRFGEIDTSDIHVLRTVLHRNKLRTGHLRGNRFSILVRDVSEQAAERAAIIAERLERLGFPNYFGPQRFGVGGETGRLGFDLLHGQSTPGDLPRSRRKFLLRLAISAAQSRLFNEYVAQRFEDGLLHTVLPGDVMQVALTGGPFVAQDPEIEQPRYDTFETVLTGPLFGPKMKLPEEEPFRRESSLLDRHALTVAEFARFGKLAAGTRRACLIRPAELSLRPEPDGLRFDFALPRGTYATVLLREFMKNDLPA